MYRAIDLFAGIGGIRLGFERAFGQIETVFTSEFDAYAAKTYAMNFSTPARSCAASDSLLMDTGARPPYVYGDITCIDERDIPAFDICLAGFPCQAFSQAGRRRGFDDDYRGQTRGTLFREVVRICEHHRPALIFCENVKGLVHHDRGRTLEVIEGAFGEIGYKVFTKVLNSKDFGVPQNRERVYLVCFREDVAPARFAFPSPVQKAAVLRDILDAAPVPSKYYLSTRYVQTLREHKARHAARGHGFGYEVRDLDGIAGTIVVGGMGRERNLIVDHREHSTVPTTHIKGEVNSEDIRKMTPREWARLQGFPDDYRLKLADTHLYKQLGNSVTVPVIEAIAAAARKILDAGKVVEMREACPQLQQAI